MSFIIWYQVEIEEEKNRSKLVITEIPYGVIRENIVLDVVKVKAARMLFAL